MALDQLTGKNISQKMSRENFARGKMDNVNIGGKKCGALSQVYDESSIQVTVLRRIGNPKNRIQSTDVENRIQRAWHLV